MPQSLKEMGTETLRWIFLGTVVIGLCIFWKWAEPVLGPLFGGALILLVGTAIVNVGLHWLMGKGAIPRKRYMTHSCHAFRRERLIHRVQGAMTCWMVLMTGLRGWEHGVAWAAIFWVANWVITERVAWKGLDLSVPTGNE